MSFYRSKNESWPRYNYYLRFFNLQFTKEEEHEVERHYRLTTAGEEKFRASGDTLIVAHIQVDATFHRCAAYYATRVRFNRAELLRLAVQNTGHLSFVTMSTGRRLIWPALGLSRLSRCSQANCTAFTNLLNMYMTFLLWGGWNAVWNSGRVCELEFGSDAGSRALIILTNYWQSEGWQFKPCVQTNAFWQNPVTLFSQPKCHYSWRRW